MTESLRPARSLDQTTLHHQGRTYTVRVGRYFPSGQAALVAKTPQGETVAVLTRSAQRAPKAPPDQAIVVDQRPDAEAAGLVTALLESGLLAPTDAGVKPDPDAAPVPVWQAASRQAAAA